MFLSASNARTVRELRLAHHILALEGVLDHSGHVSARNPADATSFLMARAGTPKFIVDDDILEHDLEGNVSGVASGELAAERFVHAAIYEQRSDVNAIVHGHTTELIAFGVGNVPFRAVIHVASSVGAAPVPIWDHETEFGDSTFLVSSVKKGHSLALTLADRTVVLMRGHGFTAAGGSLIYTVKLAAALPKNARVLLNAVRLGGTITQLSPGEVALRERIDFGGPAAQRQWEYWSRKVGVPYELGGL